MAKSFIDVLEQQELIQKLIDNGQGELVEAFLSNENKIYTKKDRLNKSGACRILGCKPKQLEDRFEQCRRIIENN